MFNFFIIFTSDLIPRVAQCWNSENECPERVNVEGIIRNVHHYFEKPLSKKTHTSWSDINLYRLTFFKPDG